ncbi:MAG TPA: amidohydrolase family protein, partial [bacterium]|nr:amidohydrolase family protein [bacterium]
DLIYNRLKDKNMRRKILYDIKTGKMIWPHTGRNTWSLNLLKILGWESLAIMSVVTDKNKHLEGKTIPEISKLWGKEPFDCICDLLLEEDGRVLVFSAIGEPEDSLSERSLFAALKHPEVSISTDTILMGFGKPSYLFYGAYPKFISRYINKMKLLDLETGIRKITGLPAEYFGLKQRGLVKRKYYADLVVFDPKTINPNCNFVKPEGVPTGIDHVFINGKHVYSDGNLALKGMPGQLLRHN